MTTFTTAETKLLTACMRCMNSDVSHCIDFDKVALEAGYKDAKNAKVMFSRLKKAKLDGATTGAALPKPTTPSKKGKSSGVMKFTAGGGATGGRGRKGAKAVAVANGGAVGLDAELRDDDEEEVMAVKAENGGGGNGDGSGMEVDGSGEDVVKEEHDGGMDGQVVNGFTAINRASVSEADELADQEEA